VVSLPGLVEVGARTVVTEWDGLNPPNYLSPVLPGDRIRLTLDRTTIETVVAAVEGFVPGVIECEHGLRVDLPGWTLEVIGRD